MKKLISLIAISFAFIGSNAQGVWTQKANLGLIVREGSSAFSIGTKGYVVSGVSPGPTYSSDLWEYDQATDTWTQRAAFPGTPRSLGVAFAIGTKGYYGTGNNCCPNNSNYNDFWEYDPAMNTWSSKASVPYSPWGAVGFSIGNKGYIGLGVQANHFNNFYEYDQALNTWTMKANFPAAARREAVAFSIGSKGYIGTGRDFQNGYKDFWEYDPIGNSWLQKANVGGIIRDGGVGFSIGNKGYIGTGANSQQDFWEYDLVSNTWVQMADFGGGTRSLAIGFSIGNKGYIGTGRNGNGDNKDFWEWGACAVAPNQPLGITGPVSICEGTTNTYSIAAVNGATSYTWTLPNGWTGTSITTSISATASSTSGNVSVTADNACGSSPAQSIAVVVHPIYSVNSSTSICQGDSILLAGTYKKVAGTYTDNLLSINGCDSTVVTTLIVNPLPTVSLPQFTPVCADAAIYTLTGGLPAGGTYSGIGVTNNQFNPAIAGAGTHTITYSYTDANTGCSNSATNTILVYPSPTVPTISVNGTTLTSSAASGNQWYLNGTPINGATNQTFVCTVNGIYTVCVTDANGCKSCSAVLNFTTIGISENKNGNEISIYPNPFSSTINVISSTDAALGTCKSIVIVYNTLGEIIYSTQLTSQPLTINLGEVPEGIYFLQVKNENGIVTEKIIKQ